MLLVGRGIDTWHSCPDGPSPKVPLQSSRQSLTAPPAQPSGTADLMMISGKHFFAFFGNLFPFLELIFAALACSVITGLASPAAPAKKAQ